MQQDAHEFLNYLLNTIADLLQEERKQDKTNGRLANGTLDSQNNNSNATPAPTWVHEIFQGTLTNETRCLTCETVRCLIAGERLIQQTSSTVCVTKVLFKHVFIQESTVLLITGISKLTRMKRLGTRREQLRVVYALVSMQAMFR